MQQKRLILALLISTTILFGWNFLFPAKPTPQNKPNQNSTGTSSPQVTPSPAAVQPQAKATPGPPQSETSPERKLVVRTPLYEVVLDSRGALVVSWVLIRNKANEQPLWSVAGSRSKEVRLELVSEEGLKRRELPLKLVTGDPGVDSALSSKNYRIEGLEASTGDTQITLGANEKKQLSLVLHDEATGIDAVKTLSFDGNSYSVALAIRLKRSDQVVPQVKVQIGPSIGDQGISRYTFYSVAPEAVAFVGDKVERLAASAINDNKTTPDHADLKGAIDWAGVGDTYFAMVAIPSKKTEGLEYRTTAFEHPSNGKPEKRYLISALVPVTADGSRMVLYTGPKDHHLLKAADGQIGADVGRQLDLEGLINFGWFSYVSRPIAEPILWSIKELRDLTNSYGVAIILFTIVIYSLFFPLKWRSSKAMKKAQKLAPRMKELQEKIKGMKQNDPRLKELQVEQLRLMKEGNPLGGCLPLLIQMPFLFALYRAITISLDFRQASFLWLPDLSAGDPYHILEVLMAGTMIVLQLITPAPSADPLQRKMMAVGMPLFMLYVLWGAPSGLLVYWLVGNIVGFSQQFLINRWTKSEDDEEPPGEKRAESRSSKKVA